MQIERVNLASSGIGAGLEVAQMPDPTRSHACIYSFVLWGRRHTWLVGIGWGQVAFGRSTDDHRYRGVWRVAYVIGNTWRSLFI
jgi:hypothetical protein